MFSPVASVLFVCGGVTVGLGQVRSCLYALLGELYFPHCLGFFLGGVVASRNWPVLCWFTMKQESLLAINYPMEFGVTETVAQAD